MKSSKLNDASITLIDTVYQHDQELKSQLLVKYPNAVPALLKRTGDFLYISQSEEVNMHLQVHLRRLMPEVEVEE